MSGHSKWANIKHRKAAQDAKKGKIFTRMGKELSIAAKQGGGDLDSNFKLRTLVDKARAANMPLDNITRAIKRGTGELPGVTYEEQTYEGYGPEGVAVIVECLTDNKKRTVAEMRHAFLVGNGNLAEHGAVSWMFEKKGVVRANTNGQSEDYFIEKLLDFEISDIEIDDNTVSVIALPKHLEEIKKTLQDAGHAVESAELEWVANNPVDVASEKEHKVISFLEALEELDDVQNVFTNMA